MKREQRLYVNGAGEYRGLVDETEAFLYFVEAIEVIIAEEQRIYWRNRGDNDRASSRSQAQAGQGAVGKEAHKP